MARSKAKHIAAVNTLPNVIQKPGLVDYSNYQAVILELACGKGDYTLELARQLPTTLCIGIDKKADRIWTGATIAQQEKLENVYFIRTNIALLSEYIPVHSVDSIWITFPDPFLKPSDTKYRLTAPAFLLLYQRLLQPNGIVHLKTDDDTLFAYSQTSVQQFGGKITECIADIDQTPVENNVVYITTTYERKHRFAQKPIHYLAFSL
jgi:tRNA (guanine-N7-)-methyltransferase